MAACFGVAAPGVLFKRIFGLGNMVRQALSASPHKDCKTVLANPCQRSSHDGGLFETTVIWRVLRVPVLVGMPRCSWAHHLWQGRIRGRLEYPAVQWLYAVDARPEPANGLHSWQKPNKLG